MGNVANAVSAVTSAVGVVDNIVSYKNNKDKQKEENRILEEEKRIKEEQIEVKKQQYKEEKTNLLKVKLASQRAKLGANGINATSGSSVAYLSNLEKNVDEEIAKNDYFADLNLQNENNIYNYKKKVNLLNSSKNNYNVFSDTLKSTTQLFSSLWKI